MIAIAIVIADSELLVARRKPDVHLGRLWEFPGGKCEPGESVEAAAEREALEECGVVATAQARLTPRRVEYPDRVLILSPVVMAWRSGEPQPLDNDGCGWVAISELDQLDMPAGNEEIVRELRNWLAQKRAGGSELA